MTPPAPASNRWPGGRAAAMRPRPAASAAAPVAEPRFPASCRRRPRPRRSRKSSRLVSTCPPGCRSFSIQYARVAEGGGQAPSPVPLRRSLRAPAQIDAEAARVEVAELPVGLVVLVAIPFGGDAGVRFEVVRRAEVLAPDQERQRAAVLEAGHARVDRERRAEEVDPAFLRLAILA